MNSIQNLLVPILLILALIHLLFFKNKIANRILFILLFITSLVFVISPDLSNRIAHWLGVDTGADLVFYVSIVIFYSVFIFLYSKIRTLQAVQTELIRKIAIDKARKPNSSSEEEKDA